MKKRIVMIILSMAVLITGCMDSSGKFVTQIPEPKSIEDKLYIRSVYIDEMKSIYKNPADTKKKINFFTKEDVEAFNASIVENVTANKLYKEAELVKKISDVPSDAKNILIIGVGNQMLVTGDEGVWAISEVRAVLMNKERQVVYSNNFTSVYSGEFFNIGMVKTWMNKSVAFKILEDLNRYNKGIEQKVDKYEFFKYYGSIDEILAKLPPTLSWTDTYSSRSFEGSNFRASYTPTYYLADIKWYEEVKRLTEGYDLSKID